EPWCPNQIEHVFHVLQIHRQAFNAVGDLTGDRLAVEPAHLLKISELGDFHAIEPDFPAQPPGTEGWILPVVFHEANIMSLGIDTERAQRFQIQIHDIEWRRLEYDLELVVMLHAIRIVAIAAILGTTRWLHVCGAPGLWSDSSQERRRMRSSSANFHVVRLQNGAAAITPVSLQR